MALTTDPFHPEDDPHRQMVAEIEGFVAGPYAEATTGSRYERFTAQMVISRRQFNLHKEDSFWPKLEQELGRKIIHNLGSMPANIQIEHKVLDSDEETVKLVVEARVADIKQVVTEVQGWQPRQFHTGLQAAAGHLTPEAVLEALMKDEDAISAIFQKMYTKAVIAICRHCEAANAVTNAVCVQCGAPSGRAEWRYFERQT